VLALAVVVWVGNKSSPVQTQELDRVLEIERYPNEPLQLVRLRIGAQSVKERIKQKFKDDKSKWAIDSVKFREQDDWVKRLSITFRNASDKPIYGIQGLLFFKPVGFPMLFSLHLSHAKELRREPLQPGAEIELSVDQNSLNQTLENAKNHGADLRGAALSFSLDTVIFSDELRWSRGFLVRPDSAVPNKWVPVDQPLALKRGDQPQINNASAPFVRVSLRSHARAGSVEPSRPFSMVFATCTDWNGGFQGTPCSGDLLGCINRTDLDDNINPGLLSHVAVSGVCVDERAPIGQLACTQNGSHSRLQNDPNCQVCPDADGDGFQAASCGGQDCNDNPSTGANINPSASENCYDGIDNNCNGQIDDADCACIIEGDRWDPGGGIDCSLCTDGIDNDCDGQTDGQDVGCTWFCTQSPVVIDVAGNGFDLTDPENGVNFDLDNDGARERLSWTAPQTDDAWLALDRNGDGVVTNGAELFGNFTPQPNPPAGYTPNGFNALKEYDLASIGGNGDGLINERDAVFKKLLLWQDWNHNGVSETNELHSLSQLGISAIECNYKESRRRDRYGNQFRYAAKVRDIRETNVGRWAWDVFLRGESLTVDNILRPRVFRPVERTYELSVIELLTGTQ
jgi:hypothetical protein